MTTIGSSSRVDSLTPHAEAKLDCLDPPCVVEPRATTPPAQIVSDKQDGAGNDAPSQSETATKTSRLAPLVTALPNEMALDTQRSTAGANRTNLELQV